MSASTTVVTATILMARGNSTITHVFSIDYNLYMLLSYAIGAFFVYIVLWGVFIPLVKSIARMFGR